jgi:hypothetical protein
VAAGRSDLGVGELAALGVGRRGGALLVDPVKYGDGVVVVAATPPRTEHVVLVLGQRPDHGRLLRRVEREHAALVAQQHHRAAGGLARGGDRIRLQHLGLGLIRSEQRVRVLEQPGAELHAQDPAHGVVDPPHRDPALPQQLRPEVADERARHLGVDPRVERERRRVRAVGGDAMAALRHVAGVLRRARPQLRDRSPVALDEAVEAPLALEDVGHQVAVAAARNAVQRVERAHEGVGAGVERRLERWQVQVAEPLLRHVGRVVVAAGLRLAVGREVLRAGDQLAAPAVVTALCALDARGGHHRVQVGILACGL